MNKFGDKNKLCFLVGDKRQGKLQEVDIWAGNILLTPIDNMAYLPQFIAALEREKREIDTGDICQDYIYFNHGPTTDDVVGSITLAGQTAQLKFEIDDVNCLVSIEVEDLLTVYVQTIESLRGINA